MVLILLSCAAAACSKPNRSSVSHLPVEAAAPTGAATFEEVGSQVVLKAATTYPAPLEIVEEAPVSLTAGDGTGLRLVRYHARSAIHGPLAFTELHLTFENPRDRALEGRFQLALPEGAAISRLAMKIDGGWQEAEVVELTQARRAYEDFLHRAQDPALLEQEAGNLFRARIFPIAARAKKELIVSFSQELRSRTADFELPLKGLPQVDQLEIEAVLADAGGKRTRLSKRGWVPDANFRVRRPRVAQALRAGALFASYVSPNGSGQRAPIKSVTFAFDTSASRAPGFARSVDQLGDVIAGLAAAGDPKVAVIAFDQETTPIYTGKASGFGAAAERRLLARRPLGASDLGGALRAAAAIGHQRLVVFGDAVATAGVRESAELVAIARGLAVDRIDVIVRGGIRDRDAAMALATAKGGAVLDGDRAGGAQLARRLGEKVANGVKVAVPGAKWVWPQTLDGVMAGETRVVYGMLETARAPLSISVGGETSRVSVLGAPAPMLSRATARAEIARLEARLATMGSDAGKRREQIRQQIIAVSTTNRVLSRFTGLLVLETEDDYRRFNIQRTALADILTIDGRGRVVARSRDQLVLPEKVPEIARTGDDDFKADKAKEKKEAQKQSEAPGGEVADAKPIPAPKPEPAADQPAPPPATSRPSPEPEAERVARPDLRTQLDGGSSGSNAGASAGDDDDEDDAEATVARRESEAPSEPEEEPEEKGPPPITGTFATIRGLIDAKKLDQALVEALAWQREKPGDVMALVALGEALEAAGHQRLAARAYGSIIDLFPSRADLRRYAGMRLARLDAGVTLAADSFAAAVASRPDHLTGHRLLAYAHARAGRWSEAMSALEAGLDQRYPSGRFAGGRRVLSEDLAIIAAAWIAAEPNAGAEVKERLAARKLAPAGPSVRFVLSWETDANDVDFHIYDAKGGHASFRNKALPSGGELFADITNGYGPECFAIEGAPSAAPYRLRAHYYSRGPMGYGIGQLEVVSWNGKRLEVEARPFVVMNDGAYLELGSWSR